MPIARRTVRGACPEGERKTERALRPLERAGWTVVHDAPAPSWGNYDHVVVGPNGVYLMETKKQQGIVDIRGGSSCLSWRRDLERSVVFRRYRPRALDAAANIREYIQEQCGHSTWVQAVVVFWSEFPDGLIEDGRCVYIHGSGLRAWLGAQEARLDGRQVEQIAEVLDRLRDKRPVEAVG
jgi:hypothetical protein